MFIGVSRVELRIPASGSLKSKRHVVKGLIGSLRSAFPLAVAEVDNQDQWKHASLGLACVAESGFHAKRVLTEAHRHIERDGRVELFDREIDVRSWEDR